MENKKENKSVKGFQLKEDFDELVSIEDKKKILEIQNKQTELQFEVVKVEVPTFILGSYRKKTKMKVRRVKR
jgi:hypothetical protein